MPERSEIPLYEDFEPTFDWIRGIDNIAIAHEDLLSCPVSVSEKIKIDEDKHGYFKNKPKISREDLVKSLDNEALIRYSEEFLKELRTTINCSPRSLSRCNSTPQNQEFWKEFERVISNRENNAGVTNFIKSLDHNLYIKPKEAVPHPRIEYLARAKFVWNILNMPTLILQFLETWNEAKKKMEYRLKSFAKDFSAMHKRSYTINAEFFHWYNILGQLKNNEQLIMELMHTIEEYCEKFRFYTIEEKNLVEQIRKKVRERKRAFEEQRLKATDRILDIINVEKLLIDSEMAEALMENAKFLEVANDHLARDMVSNVDLMRSYMLQLMQLVNSEVCLALKDNETEAQAIRQRSLKVMDVSWDKRQMTFIEATAAIDRVFQTTRKLHDTKAVDRIGNIDNYYRREFNAYRDLAISLRELRTRIELDLEEKKDSPIMSLFKKDFAAIFAKLEKIEDEDLLHKLKLNELDKFFFVRSSWESKLDFVEKRDRLLVYFCIEKLRKLAAAKLKSEKACLKWIDNTWKNEVIKNQRSYDEMRQLENRIVKILGHNVFAVDEKPYLYKIKKLPSEYIKAEKRKTGEKDPFGSIFDLLRIKKRKKRNLLSTLGKFVKEGFYVEKDNMRASSMETESSVGTTYSKKIKSQSFVTQKPNKMRRRKKTKQDFDIDQKPLDLYKSDFFKRFPQPNQVELIFGCDEEVEPEPMFETKPQPEGVSCDCIIKKDDARKMFKGMKRPYAYFRIIKGQIMVDWIKRFLVKDNQMIFDKFEEGLFEQYRTFLRLAKKMTKYMYLPGIKRELLSCTDLCRLMPFIDDLRFFADRYERAQFEKVLERAKPKDEKPRVRKQLSCHQFMK